MIALALGLQVHARYDYYDQAIKLMESSPLIDTHVDLPQIIRSLSRCRHL